MAVKINNWSPEESGQQVLKRWRHASDSRKRLEDQWLRNERSVYGSNGLSGFTLSIEALNDDAGLMDDTGNEGMNVSYVFKNLRFLHSQLSANPPSVAMKPASSDQEDGRRADAADRVVRFAIRKYQMQERVDQLTLGALIYGTAALRTTWDSTLGDIIGYDEETGEMQLEGDIAINVPHTWNLYLDPDARCVADIKWVIERQYIDYDAACLRWPEHKEILEQIRVQGESQQASDSGSGKSLVREPRYNSVEVLEYWETGLPANGYLGRYAVVTASGKTLTPCRPSPFRFPRAGSISEVLNSGLPDEIIERKLQSLPQMAKLPYHILTDIDVVNSVWGKSAVEYASRLQDVLTQIDSAYLDNIRAHGAARMVIPKNTEVNLDMTNSPWDVVEVDSNQAPFFMEVPQLMPEMNGTRMSVKQGIDDVMGVNEAMFGQQSREQSGASMQYATNQGNMIRRRIFNKYVLCVESIYKAILDLVRKHWTVERNIRVLGKEKALEAIALKGADIDGGYDVVGEYGTTLSLDPITRREEIMALQPMFEKAGVPTRMSLKLMKLNELEGMYDKLQMAEDRQKEYFDAMLAGQGYIPPQELEDHENMIAWALDYVMTAEFKYLEEDQKVLVKQHIRDRISMSAQEKSGGLSAQPQAPGPAGNPGELPAQPGPTEMAPAPAMAPAVG